MNRVFFLIDGFNLYHSVRDIQNDFGLRTKWLDIRSLCNSFLHWVGNKATLGEIFYFSAYAYHLNDPGVIARHEAYVKCLRSTGVKDEMGRFKPKDIACPQYDRKVAKCKNCNGQILRHEEKETDVAIGMKLMELLSTDTCDTVVLITGDTDLAPAIKTANRLFPDKSTRFIFPYRRKNNELAKLAPSMTIKPKHYQQYQLSNPFTMPDGTLIYKPLTW